VDHLPNNGKTSHLVVGPNGIELDDSRSVSKFANVKEPKNSHITITVSGKRFSSPSPPHHL